jgi:lysophospholipase L1-like esterase
VISQIAQFANFSLKQLPNVILLMAGTNDMNIPTDPTTASDRLGSLIDELVIAVPDAVVLVLN